LGIRVVEIGVVSVEVIDPNTDISVGIGNAKVSAKRK
jgi:hypothetical protein